MVLNVRAVAPPLHADEDGVMRVGETRVTLDTVIHAFEAGSTAEEIVSRFSVLRLADVYTVIAYYLNQREAVQQYLKQQEETSIQSWSEIESKSDHRIFRERLLAGKRDSTS
jgi:uncharacterized protein (DUF433 family)